MAEIDFQPIDFKEEAGDIDFQPIDFQPEAPAPAMAEEMGVLSKLGKRAEGIGKVFTEPIASVRGGWEESQPAGFFEAGPQRLIRAGGQIMAGVGDIAGEAAKGLYRAITPEPVQKGLATAGKSILDTEIGQMGLKALQSGGEVYGKFKAAYPDMAKDIEAVTNIAMYTPMAKVGGQLVKKGYKTIAAIPSKIPPSGTALKKEIEHGIRKGVRPYVSTKGQTAAQTEGYYRKAQEAVEGIIENKTNLQFTDDIGEVVAGRLPQNLQEFHGAIGQTKKVIFDKYDDIAKQAGKQGATVDLSPIAKELDAIAKNKVLLTEKPDIVNYAMARSEAYKGTGKYTAPEAQEAIAALNHSLESFYKNPSYDTWSKAYIDSMVVNNLRKSLDDIIEKTTEGGYQALKNQYGSLKAIERDVSRRAVTDARKNIKGLVENLTDVSTAASAVHGLLSMNPKILAASATAKGMAAWRARLLDPNRVIGKMFERSEKIIEARKKFKSISTLSDDELKSIIRGK